MTHSDSGCAGFRQAGRGSRRTFLQVGGLWGLGLGLADLLRAQTQPAGRGTYGRARSVIMLYLHGGHAQQETWDPKPDGPSPERGELGPLRPGLPGARTRALLRR